ncbi:MAG: NfeD family protein [Prevotella sp.]|jgi:membrane-bound ClpP family serine protease|nr:NfeD family protein [Prevotella sp.]
MILDIAIIAFLIGLAILLLLLEIFLLPGITIAGIGGALFAIGGIVYAYTVSPLCGHITLLASAVAFGASFVWLLRSNSFNKVALKTNIESKVTSSRDLGIQVGDEGVTLSRLAPIGKARIGDVTVEAKSTGEFIDEATPVVVIRVDGYNVLVQTKDNNHIHS